MGQSRPRRRTGMWGSQELYSLWRYKRLWRFENKNKIQFTSPSVLRGSIFVKFFTNWCSKSIISNFVNRLCCCLSRRVFRCNAILSVRSRLERASPQIGDTKSNVIEFFSRLCHFDVFERRKCTSTLYFSLLLYRYTTGG